MTTEQQKQQDQNLQDVLEMIDDITKKTQPAKPAEPAPEAKPAQPAPAIKVAEVVEVAPEAKPEAIPNPSMGNGEEVEEVAEVKESPLKPLLSTLEANSEADLEGNSEEHQVSAWIEKRERTIRKLIEKYGLNETTPKPVGRALVEAVGFVEWSDNLPVYHFMEAIDTPESFRNFMRTTNGGRSTSLDALRCVFPQETLLIETTYNGQLELSKVYGGRVTIGAVKPGDFIQVAAIVTRTGNLRYIAYPLPR